MRQLPKHTVCETIALCVDTDPDQIRSSTIADSVSRPFTELQFKTVVKVRGLGGLSPCSVRFEPLV